MLAYSKFPLTIAPHPYVWLTVCLVTPTRISLSLYLTPLKLARLCDRGRSDTVLVLGLSPVKLWQLLFLHFRGSQLSYKKSSYSETTMLCGSPSSPHGDDMWREPRNPGNSKWLLSAPSTGAPEVKPQDQRGAPAWSADWEQRNNCCFLCSIFWAGPLHSNRYSELCFPSSWVESWADQLGPLMPSLSFPLWSLLSLWPKSPSQHLQRTRTAPSWSQHDHDMKTIDTNSRMPSNI